MKSYLHTKYEVNKLVDVLDELPVWSAPFGLKLLDYINYKTNISALDIGFGTGFPLTEIALRLGNSSTVYGIDPWKEAVERTRQKLNLYGISNVNLIEGIAESIPLANNSIDLITSNNGINNVEDVDKVFSECARVMKSGGQLVLTMNTDKSMFEFYNTFEHVLSEMNMHKEIELMYKHIEKKRPSVDLFSSKIRENGFIIKDIEQTQFNYRFADGTAMLNHYFIRMAFMESWIKLLPTNKVKLIFEKIESNLNQQAQLLGGLTLSIPYVLMNAIKK